MENLKGFMYSTMAIGSVGLDNVHFLFKHYNNSFLVTVNAFLPWPKQNSDFQFLSFSIGYI